MISLIELNLSLISGSDFLKEKCQRPPGLEELYPFGEGQTCFQKVSLT